MADLYANFAELAAAETYGVDYQIRTVSPANATWTSIAIHGGGIEAGSSEIAEAVADGIMHFYEFDGMKPSGNGDLHITSTNFDEPQAIALVTPSPRTLSFHGYAGTDGVPETAIGGLDEEMTALVSEALTAAGFAVVTAPSEIAGTNPDNICNKNARLAGVQLEMSRAQREAFFTDFTRNGRKNEPRTQAFYDYVAAVRSAYRAYGLVRLPVVNNSRWCLLPALRPDIDLTASVSTDALAQGGGHFMALVARWLDDANYYHARLEFAADQDVILTIRKRIADSDTRLIQHTTGLTHEPFKRFRIRFAVTGITLRAKAWADGDPEPGDWQLTVVDRSLRAPGHFGMRSILSVTNTNPETVTAAWGDFDELSSTRQTFTVERSRNGVVKPLPAGADVRLAKPTYVAR